MMPILPSLVPPILRLDTHSGDLKSLRSLSAAFPLPDHLQKDVTRGGEVRRSDRLPPE